MKVSKKAKTTKAKNKSITYPRTAGDVFVTQKMLYSVRDELKEHTEKKFHEVQADSAGLKSEFIGLKSDFVGLKSDFLGLKSEFRELKSEIHDLKSEVHDMKSSIHRIELLFEEQNNRNKIVLDGLSQLFLRQNRIEKKVDSNF